MSGKKFFQIDPENRPNQTTRERVVSERGRKELPPGTKGGENLKPDRHYEHKQYAFDSYCKKVLKCEACNGYRQISRRQKRFTSLEELSEAEMAQLAVYDRYTQFKRLWQYIVTRTVKERSYYRYEDGKRVKHTVTPVLGEKAAHNGKVVYSLDFEVTPHQLRHTYITNLIHASVDPKTVQYLAGHESSKITMDIYAKVKYNRPDELVRSMNCAFASWDAAQ